jgi:PelA/Pel-15E family pectate lyase
MLKVLACLLCLLGNAATAAAQTSVPWNSLLAQPAAWYATPEAARIADNLLLFQRGTGGWPKNLDMTAVLTAPERGRLEADRRLTDSTIDNGATTTEIQVLARVFDATSEQRFRDGALAGLDYLLRAQYPNGGWPQDFPLRDNYTRHITFNDNAMVRVLQVLGAAAEGRAPFGFVDEARRTRAREAARRGLDLILAAQIRVDGRPTVWCAQHDAVTLAPARARTYELPSFSGSESVGIVRYLMTLPDPSPAVVSAIEGAVSWFRAHTVSGIRVERRPDPSAPRGFDLAVVADPKAPPQWARFYDLETGRPIFVGRDGVKRERLADIEVERRTGYSYLGDYARELLEHDYPAWQAARKAASPNRTGTTPSHKVDLLGYLRMSQAGLAAQLLSAARMMPEADYAFTPSQMSGTRTFAGVMTHAAAGMFDACALAGGQDNPRSGIEGTLTRKDEVVAALAESIAFCEKVFAGLTEQAAAEYLRQGPAEVPRAALLMGVLAHNAEMFGISTVYLRARNLLPPGSSAK